MDNLIFFLLTGAAWIDAFSLREDAWTCLGRTSGKRVQFGAALIDKKLIVAGGRDGLKTLNTMEYLDLSSGIAPMWSSLPPMHVNRNGLGKIRINDLIKTFFHAQFIKTVSAVLVLPKLILFFV